MMKGAFQPSGQTCHVILMLSIVTSIFAIIPPLYTCQIRDLKQDINILMTMLVFHSLSLWEFIRVGACKAKCFVNILFLWMKKLHMRQTGSCSSGKQSSRVLSVQS